MRPLARLSLSLLLALPALAQANCYFIYTGQNQLVYQSTTSPIDLSKHIADAINARFPGDYLVMIPDESACNEVRSGSRVQPRFDQVGLTNNSVNATDPALLASPLLRNSRSPAVPTASDSGNNSAAQSRVGRDLNLRPTAPGQGNGERR